MNWFAERRRMMSDWRVRIGDLPTGQKVVIPVDGIDYNWIIVHQGVNPAKGALASSSADYEGTWLLMEDIYRNNVYLDNTEEIVSDNIFDGYNHDNDSIHTYLNTTFYDMLDNEIKAYLKPCLFLSDADSDIGLVFRVPAMNLGYNWDVRVDDDYVTRNASYAFDYFKEWSIEKFTAYYNGAVSRWWTNGRIGPNGLVIYVDTDGIIGDFNHNRISAGIRPMLLSDSNYEIRRSMLL